MTSITGKPHHWLHIVRPTPRLSGRVRCVPSRPVTDRFATAWSTADRSASLLLTNASVIRQRPMRGGDASSRASLRSCRDADFQTRPRAFTLIEVLLVLALVLMIASVVTPNLMRLYQRTAVNRQAMQVQMVLARARTRAIEQMGTQVFQYRPGGTSYSIQTWHFPAESEDARYHAADNENVRNAAPHASSTHKLSSSCWFSKAPDTASSEQFIRIFFFADGTATSHQMGITGAAEETHWISIDPLTGASRRQRGARNE